MCLEIGIRDKLNLLGEKYYEIITIKFIFFINRFDSTVKFIQEKFKWCIYIVHRILYWDDRKKKNVLFL